MEINKVTQHQLFTSDRSDELKQSNVKIEKAVFDIKKQSDVLPDMSGTNESKLLVMLLIEMKQQSKILLEIVEEMRCTRELLYRTAVASGTHVSFN